MTLYVLRGRYSKRVLAFWNLLGVLDFVIAFATGFTFDTPTVYPLVLVPGFLVPLALGFHIHSLRKLYRGTHSVQGPQLLYERSPQRWGSFTGH